MAAQVHSPQLLRRDRRPVAADSALRRGAPAVGLRAILWDWTGRPEKSWSSGAMIVGSLNEPGLTSLQQILSMWFSLTQLTPLACTTYPYSIKPL